MEPDVHVLSSPSTGVQRADVGADGLGSGPCQRRGEPVPRRGQTTGPRFIVQSLVKIFLSLLRLMVLSHFMFSRVQVLIELESALLDDQPHWYKLQLHDVSSVPLPNASPYMQRRGLQADPCQTNRRLQSEPIHSTDTTEYTLILHPDTTQYTVVITLSNHIGNNQYSYLSI